jgi:hypothetical protein
MEIADENFEELGLPVAPVDHRSGNDDDDGDGRRGPVKRCARAALEGGFGWQSDLQLVSRFGTFA